MTKPLSTDAVISFLTALTELSRKHGIEIVGCGCCGSPFLLPIKRNGEYTIDDDWQDAPSCLRWQEQE